MKRILTFVLLAILTVCIVSASVRISEPKSLNDRLIRFHVIANSDSFEDQAVKLKVRDAILRDIGPKLAKSSSREESLKLIKDNAGRIEEISDSVLKSEGKSYTAKAMIGDFQFPIKTYGTITLPAGEYKALRVVLGDGNGKNWWCVMFPPLCFIDITRGVTSKETDEELKKVLNDEEIQSITAFRQVNEKKEVVANPGGNKSANRDNNAHSKQLTLKPSVEFKFKSVELIDKLKHIIKNNL